MYDYSNSCRMDWKIEKLRNHKLLFIVNFSVGFLRNNIGRIDLSYNDVKCGKIVTLNMIGSTFFQSQSNFV